MTILITVYTYLWRFLLFWRDFLIGDDWWGAGIVLAGLGLTYVAVHYHVVAWWIPVVAVVLSLGQNLARARRRAAGRRAAGSGRR